MLSRRRLTTFVVIIIVLMMAATLQTIRVQVFTHAALAKQVEVQQTKDWSLNAARGSIFDRNGNILAVSHRAFLFRVDGNTLTDTVGVAMALAPVVQQPAEFVRNNIEGIIRSQNAVTPTRSSILFYDLTQAQTDQITSTLKLISRGGLRIEKYWARSYPQGKLAGPLIGFMNLEPRGFTGVEGYYNQSLDGANGEVSSIGRMNFQGITLTQQGADVVLTIDSALQKYVEERLVLAAQAYEPEGGSIIVMDTKTGAILASASMSGYDPNLAMDLASQPGAKLFDPAVTSLYEPGSVIKVLTAGAALQNGTATTVTLFKDEVKFDVDGSKIMNSDRAAHGDVAMEEMLQKSINVVAAKMALEMGPAKFYNSFKQFGVGTKSGVDLGGEQAGIMRTPSNIRWSKADLAVNAYGQGMLMSPMQVLAAINAVANDGVLVQPYIVQQWLQADGTLVKRPVVPIAQPMTVENARLLRSLMQRATASATRKVLFSGYTIAGKTGTADWYNERGITQETTFQTYVGMVPAEQPRITILIKFDKPKSSRWAADTTVPVFRDVAMRAVEILGIPPAAGN